MLVVPEVGHHHLKLRVAICPPRADHVECLLECRHPEVSRDVSSNIIEVIRLHDDGEDDRRHEPAHRLDAP